MRHQRIRSGWWIIGPYIVKRVEPNLWQATLNGSWVTTRPTLRAVIEDLEAGR